MTDEGKEPTSVKEMVSTINKHSDGTNVIGESIKTFSNPDGSTKKNDLLSNSLESALELLKELIELAKSNPKLKDKHKVKWNFRTSPHAQFQKTLDDTFCAFLLWARVFDDEEEEGAGEGDGDGNEGERTINVSKAFRRLESYAEWMEETADDLTEPELTSSSVETFLKAWAMNTSIDKDERLAWWVDMKAVDMDKVKHIDPKDSLRAFVWYAHAVMYNENAQKNGLIFIENLDKMGMIATFSLMPMKLSTKLDRLTIGVLPIKMKALYMLDIPRWVSIFMKFLGIFLSKKMKKRLIVLKEWSALEEIVGGKERIPVGFGKSDGSLAVDLVEDMYFS